MRRASRFVLLFGVLLAVGGGAALFMYLQSLGEASAQQAPPVEIVVAAVDIPSYRPITTDMVRLETVPAEAASTDNVRDLSAVVGKALDSPAKAGQQLLSSAVTERGFAYTVPKGTRAMAVAVDRLSVLNGLLREGDYVDVVYMGKFPQVNYTEGQDGQYSDPKSEAPTGKTIVQNVQVLKIQDPVESSSLGPTGGTGEEAQPADDVPREWTVVLAVTDQQAELIRFAMTNGTASLVMRAGGDTTVEETTGVTEEILNNESGVPVPVQPEE